LLEDLSRIVAEVLNAYQAEFPVVIANIPAATTRRRQGRKIEVALFKPGTL